MVFTKLLTLPGDLIMPGGFLNSVAKLYPPKYFSPVWNDENGVKLAEPSAVKSYVIFAGVAAYSARYLFLRHRG
jgi:hypothetical protein